MIVTFGGIKGGSGKSTAALHLAALYAGRGKSTILLDADKQATSSDFHQLRQQSPELVTFTCVRKDGPGVLQAARDFARRFDVVLIDTGGHDSPSQRAALVASDTAWFPVVPGPFDVWTLEPLLAMLAEVWAINPGLKAFTYINRLDHRSRLREPTEETLASFNAQGLRSSGVVIRRRSAFTAASGFGRAVHEHSPLDPKAVAEIQQLFTAVDTANTEEHHGSHSEETAADVQAEAR